MRSGASVVTTMKNAGSPVLKRKKHYKFCDYTADAVLKYFSARMPLQKQDLEDCIELMREGLDFNKPLVANTKQLDLDDLVDELNFLDIGRGLLGPSVKEVLFYDKMVAFIRQSDCSVLSAKDQADLHKMLTSNIPRHSERLLENLLSVSNLGPREAYDYIANTFSPDDQMKLMTLLVEGWQSHCASLAIEFTTMLNLVWKNKNMPGTLNFDADMFQKQYVDPLLSAALEFNHATAGHEKVSAYIKSYACARQLEDGMCEMAACVYPEKYHDHILSKKEDEELLMTWKQSWQQTSSLRK